MILHTLLTMFLVAGVRVGVVFALGVLFTLAWLLDREPTEKGGKG